MERAIELFAAVNFLVIGLSHIVQPRAWVDFFAKLHNLGRVGAFAEGFLYLNMGTIIVALHNVWTLPEIVLTLIGWIYVLKAVQRFVAPTTVLRIYAKMTHERAWLFQVAGSVLVALSLLLGWIALQKFTP